MTFSIIFTFTDFQLVYATTRGGLVNSTHLMATLALQRGIPNVGGDQRPARHKSILRAIILLPWIVPTVLSAIAFLGIGHHDLVGHGHGLDLIVRDIDRWSAPSGAGAAP